jgi:hypothetical protein
MERTTFDSGRILRGSARRSACISLAATLSIALGSGCIDVSAIRSNIGDGGSPSGDGSAPSGGNDAGLSVGLPCGSNGQCQSGFCTDGYCCDQACRGPCTFCGPADLVGGYPRAGYCLPVSPGLRDPHGVCAASTCTGSVWTPAATCDGAGGCVRSTSVTCASNACNPFTNTCSCQVDADCGPGIACTNGGCGLQALGQICAADGECASDHCVEGVCCDGACANGCQTCTAAGSVGTCLARPGGSSPRDPTDCPVDSPSSCGFDGTCSDGSCRQYFATPCIDGICNGAAVTGAFRCNGSGQCVEAPMTICTPYTCDSTGDATTGSCFQSCTSNAQCAPNTACDVATGSCQLKAQGAACTDDAQCPSGFCADGVCCNNACQGGCVACNLSGRIGTCWPIDAGATDPHRVCIDQGVPTCGHDGTCDGLGGCANYAANTACLAPSCVGNLLDVTGTCDGSGTCRSGGVLDCGPFRCIDGACIADCQTDSQCAPGRYCLNGSCGLKGLGQSCQSDSACASNHCADGVCCDGTCSDACRSCNLPSSPGHCTPVAVDALDPHGACLDDGPASCGMNGKCDGGGDCAHYGQGTICASAACVGGYYTAPSTCNTGGQCVAPAPVSCFPYVCDGAQCFGNCSTSDQCASPNVCLDASCGPKSNGASCSNATECASDVCAQGICCATACAGACQSCDLGTSIGTCVNVPAHLIDPSGFCADQGAASCGADGKCDGNGGCEKYPQGTACLGQSCQSGSQTFTAASSCDGLGNCLTPTPISCAPFQCGATACKNACASDADCVAPATCNSSGSCGVSTQEMVSK